MKSTESRSRFTENKTVLSQFTKNKDIMKITVQNHCSQPIKHLFLVSRKIILQKLRNTASMKIDHDSRGKKIAISHFTGKKESITRHENTLYHLSLISIFKLGSCNKLVRIFNKVSSTPGCEKPYLVQFVSTIYYIWRRGWLRIFW